MAPASDTELFRLIRKLESITQISDAEWLAILKLPASVRVSEPRQDIVRGKDRPS